MENGTRFAPLTVMQWEIFFSRDTVDGKMKIAKRIFLLSILAILMTCALSGSGSASGTSFLFAPMAARGSLSPPGIDFKFSLPEPGEADGTGIPGIPEQRSENAPIAASPLLVIVGLGLIAAALWGKKRFQK
jgi:hypothetical protein